VPDDDDARSGLIYGASAYLLWGLFPLYWPLLEPAGTVEILAQRMAWSLVVMAVILRITRGFGRVRAVLANRRQRSLLVAAAVVVTVNWGTYIYGVNSGHVVETSLGYFINPLFTILLGVFVLGERLRPMQWTAVGIGTVVYALAIGPLAHVFIPLLRIDEPVRLATTGEVDSGEAERTVGNGEPGRTFGYAAGTDPRESK